MNVRVIAAGRLDAVYTARNLRRTYGGQVALLDEPSTRGTDAPDAPP